MTLPSNTADVLARFDSVLGESAREEKAVLAKQEAAALFDARQTTEDRSLISKTVIFTYAAVVTLAFFYIVFTSPSCPAGQTCADVAAWTAQMEMLRDMIVTVVLPIVTLMLGFYFGTETSRRPTAGDGGS